MSDWLHLVTEALKSLSIGIPLAAAAWAAAKGYLKAMAASHADIIVRAVDAGQHIADLQKRMTAMESQTIEQKALLTSISSRIDDLYSLLIQQKKS